MCSSERLLHIFYFLLYFYQGSWNIYWLGKFYQNATQLYSAATNIETAEETLRFLNLKTRSIAS